MFFCWKEIANGQKFVETIISKEAKILESPDVDNKESLRFARKDAMTVNYTTDDKQSLIPSKMSKLTIRSHENKQKYLSSAEITLTASFTTQNKYLANSVKVVKMPDNYHKDNQEYIGRMPCSQS
ncbi:hypothetical protein AVEN_210344-1 [Araneus ventricosus]|uniref:Uncharacterized protein n=1 Tax=Araneus ventricosus TaxID=182803 RepID=A0A4Y2WZ35_ARAVE|nr:hypothetical protein AVEN_210344-1 [Araneus ventricosus]